MKSTIYTNMRFIIFFLLLPFMGFSQNFFYGIVPQGNGTFGVVITDDVREAYPRQVTDYGFLDTAQLTSLAYIRIEATKNQQATAQAASFVAELNAEQTNDSIGVVIPLDYSGWAVAQFANTFDGTYRYQVRGGGIEFNVVITGSEVRRQSNNNLIAALVPETSNWMVVTPNGGGDPIHLYRTGRFFVGRNSSDQIVTLKRL